MATALDHIEMNFMREEVIRVSSVIKIINMNWTALVVAVLTRYIGYNNWTIMFYYNFL